MKKNDIFELEITDATVEGAGVGRTSDGKVVFAQGCCTGDVIEAKIIKVKSDYLIARAERFLKRSPDRVSPDCEAYENHCGGCQMRHISYEAEKHIKLSHVLSCLRDIDCAKPQDIYCASLCEYRNKAAYPVDSELKFGCYSARSHRIIPHKVCLLEKSIFTEIAYYFTELCRKYGVSGYDEESGKGILRHIIMRANRLGEVLLMPVVNCKKLPHEQEIAREILQKFPSVIGISVNVNTKNTNVIAGSETYHLCGEKYIKETLLGRELLISARSFFQINTDACEKLYSIAREMLGDGEGRIILDLYCGIGSIGLCVAEKNDKLCGVEIIPEAIEDAKRNALLCGRNQEDTHFVCGNASIGVKECCDRFGPPDVITVDPPRKGLSPEVIKAILSVSPSKIVYISCNPATLGRDLKIFAENGYATAEVKCVDMFPRTGHVETVALLTK